MKRTLLSILLGSIAVLRAAEPAAITTAIAGPVKSRAGSLVKALQTFEWLDVGAVIEVEAGGQATIAFADGRRYEVVGPATASIGSGRLNALSGAIHELPPIAPIPPAAIATKTGVSARGGVVRIRGGGAIKGMYPREGFFALANDTVLSFEAVAGAESYKVEVETERGECLYRVETGLTEVAVPAGLLKPGSLYYWRVRTVGLEGKQASGEAELSTLPEKDAVQRALFAETALARSNFGLLAVVDRRMGLAAEARQELRKALDRTPDDAVLRRLLDGVDREIRGHVQSNLVTQ